MPRAPWWVITALACACSGAQPSSSGGSAGADGSDGMTQEPPMPVPPLFVDPADGELTIASTRSTPVVLEVRDIRRGSTSLLLDGKDLGPLTEPHGSIASLDEDQLTLHLRGGMVPGVHALQLVTPTPGEPLYSREIRLVVIDVDPIPIEATLDSRVVARADALHAVGHREDALLLALEDQVPDDDAVLVFPTIGRGFAGPPARFGLPGHRSYSALDISADLVHQTDSDTHLVLAWRARDGQSIRFIDAPWRGNKTPGASASTLFAMDALPPAEWSEFRRPFVLGANILAEYVHALDSEQSQPGDRGLVATQRRGPGRFTPPRTVQPAPGADLDVTGPAYDLTTAETHRDHVLATRIDRFRLGVLDIDDAAASVSLRARNPENIELSLTYTNAPFTAWLAALGSRTLITRVGERPIILRTVVSGENVRFDASPARERLPMTAPSSDPVSTLLGGFIVVLVPYGASAPVQALIVLGRRVEIQALERIHCDAVATPPSTVALAGESMGFACLRDRELRFGELRLQPNDQMTE